MTSLVDTLDSKHKVSTANADTSSGRCEAREGDRRVGGSCRRLRHGAPDEVFPRKAGSFEDRSWDGSSCARTVCPFFSQRAFACCVIFLDVSTHRALSLTLVIKKKSAAFRRVLRNGKPYFTMMSLHINNHMPRDAESRNICCLQSVLFCVRNKLIWLLVILTVLRGERKALTTNRATAQSRKRWPRRTYQPLTAPRRLGVQETF